MRTDKGFNQSHVLFRLLNENRGKFITHDAISQYVWPLAKYTEAQSRHRVSCAVVRVNEWAEDKQYPWRIGTAIHIGYFIYDLKELEVEANIPPKWEQVKTEDEQLTATQVDDEGPSWP